MIDTPSITNLTASWRDLAAKGPAGEQAAIAFATAAIFGRGGAAMGTVSVFHRAFYDAMPTSLWQSIMEACDGIDEMGMRISWLQRESRYNPGEQVTKGIEFYVDAYEKMVAMAQAVEQIIATTDWAALVEQADENKTLKALNARGRHHSPEWIVPFNKLFNRMQSFIALFGPVAGGDDVVATALGHGNVDSIRSVLREKIGEPLIINKGRSKAELFLLQFRNDLALAITCKAKKAEFGFMPLYQYVDKDVDSADHKRFVSLALTQGGSAAANLHATLRTINRLAARKANAQDISNDGSAESATGGEKAVAAQYSPPPQNGFEPG